MASNTKQNEPNPFDFSQNNTPRLEVYVRAPKNTQDDRLVRVPDQQLDTLFSPSHTQNGFAVFKLTPQALVSTGASAFFNAFSDQWGQNLLYNPNADAHLTRVELAIANALKLSYDFNHLINSGITTNPAVGVINLPVETKNITLLQSQNVATILICLKGPQNITPDGYVFNPLAS